MGELAVIAKQQSSIAMLQKENPKGYADSVTNIVSEVIQISGRKEISDADRYYLIKITQDELLDQYRYLTGSEVRYAFNQGVRGRYGEYYHISLPTFIKWLDKYLESPERQQVVESRRVIVPAGYRLAQSNQVSERDNAEVYRQRADYLYKQYLESGKMPCSSCFSALNSTLEKLTYEQLKKDEKVAKRCLCLEDVFWDYKENGKEKIY